MSTPKVTHNKGLIFEIINGHAVLFGQSLTSAKSQLDALANSMDTDQVTRFAQAWSDASNVAGTFDNKFKKTFTNADLSDIDPSALKSYLKELKDGKFVIEDFMKYQKKFYGINKEVTDANIKAAREQKKASETVGTAIDVQRENISVTSKLKGVLGSVKNSFSSFGSGIISVGKSILTSITSIGPQIIASFAISFAFQWIDDLIHGAERAKEKMAEVINVSAELTEQYQEDDAAIEDLAKQYDTLYNSLQNTELSTSEIVDIKEQLLDVQNQLIEQYGLEANSIDLVNGKYEDQLNKINELRRQKAIDYLSENKENIDTQKNYLSDHKSIGVKHTKLSSETQELLKESGVNVNSSAGYSSGLFTFKQGVVHFDTEYSPEQALKDYQAISTILATSQLSDDEAGFLNDHLNKLKNAYDLDNTQKALAQVQAYQAAAAQGFDISLYDEIEGKVEQLNAAISSGNSKTAEQLKKDLQEDSELIENGMTGMTEDARAGYKSLLDSIDQTGYEKMEFLNQMMPEKFGKQIDKLKTMNLTSDDIRNAYLTDGLQNGEAQFKVIADAADEYGLSVEDVIASLTGLNVLQKSNTEIAEENAAAYAEHANTVAGLLDEQSYISSLLSDSGSLSPEQYEKLISYSKDYASALQVEGKRITVNRDALAELSATRMEESRSALEQAKSNRQMDYRNQLKDLRSLVMEYGNLTQAERDSDTVKKAAIDSASESLNSIHQEIQSYRLLEMQVLNASSALKAYTENKNNPGYGEDYGVANDAMNTLKTGFETSFTGTADFEAAVQALMPKSVIEQGISGIRQYYDETLSRYFTNDDGEVTEKLQNFVQDCIEKGLMTEDSTIENFNLADHVSMGDIDSAFGFTSEVTNSIFGKMEEVTYGQNVDWSSRLMSASESSVESLQLIEAQLLQTKAQLLAGGEFTGETAAGWSQQMQQLQTASLNTSNSVADHIEQYQKDIERLRTLQQEEEDLQSKLDSKTISDEDRQTDSESLAAKMREIEELQAKIQEPTSMEVDFAIENLQKEYAHMLEQFGIGEATDEDVRNAKNRLDIAVNFKTSQADKEQSELEKEHGKIKTRIENTPITVKIDNSPAMLAVDTLWTHVESFLHYLGINNGSHFTVTTDHYTNEYVNKYKPTLVTERTYAEFAAGSDSVPFSTTALVGELGPELQVNRREGRWNLVGLQGPEFTRVEKGDIIFNAQETLKLLKTGKVKNRGLSFAGGTKGGDWFESYRQYAHSSDASSLPDYSGYYRDLAVTSAQLADDFKNIVDVTEIFISRLDQYISNLSSIQDLYQTYRNKNQIADELIKTTLGKVNALQKSYDQYMLQANAVDLSASWKQKIRDGAIDLETVTDEDLKNQIDEFQKWYEKALDCNAEIISLQKNLRDLSNEKLSNIISDFDQATDLQDAMIFRQEALNSLIKAQGGKVSEETYQQMLSSQAGISDYLQRELELLNQELDRMLSSGVIQKYTEDWYEWQSKIEGVTRSLYDSQASVLDYKESIRELRWEGFQDGLDQLEQESSGLSDVLSLIDAQELDGKGNLTNAGKTVLGLYARQLANARKQAAEYSRALEIIQEELANGNLTQEEYNDLLDEYSSAQQKAVSDTKSARDAILSLVKDGIQEETEAYKKLIDTKKKDLQATKEYEDYAKTLRDKSSEINAVKAQIASLSGDENNRAQIRRLNEELKKLNEEYANTQKDHEYDLLLKSYDDAQSLFEEEQQKQLDALDNDLNAQNEAISRALTTAKEHYDDIYTYLDQIAEVYGARLDENITSPWMDAASAAQSYAEAIEEITGKTHVDSSQIQIPETTGKDTVPVQEEQVDSLIPGAITTSPSSSGSRKVSATSGWIAYGDLSEDVRLLQTALNALGYSCGDVDGDFGWRTLDAVKRFQADKGLIIDGLVGDETRGAFRKAGFAVGGIVQASRAYLNRLVQASGEDGVAFVKNGESILDVDTAAMFRKFTDALPRLNAMMSGASRPAQIQISYDSIIGNIETVSKDVIGDIDSIIQRSADLAVRDIRTNLKKLGVR